MLFYIKCKHFETDFPFIILRVFTLCQTGVGTRRARLYPAALLNASELRARNSARRSDLTNALVYIGARVADPMYKNSKNDAVDL